jgi:outer membrane protein
MTISTLRLGIALTAAMVLTGGGPAISMTRSAAVVPSGKSDGVRLRVEDAVARALDANPGLRAAAQKARGADRAAAASFRRHFGDVEAVAWASRYQDAQILRPISRDLLDNGISGLPFAQDQIHYGLTFDLPLFLGGKLVAGSSLARLEADEASALLEGTSWQVRANVTTVYASAQALAGVTAAYREDVAALEKTHRRLQLMVSQGKRPEVDLLKATDALEEARAQLAGAQADLTHATAVLAALLDYPVDRTFELDPLPKRPPELTADSLDWDRMVQQASTVSAAELRVRQAASRKRIVRSEFLPSLNIRGSVLEHTASGLDESQSTWELTLVASIPLFSGGRRVAAYQGAAAAERAADLALRQARLDQQAEIRGALSRFRAAVAALQAGIRRVDAADEAARIEGLRYENGAGTIEDLLRARARASAAEAFLAKSRGDVLGAAARINALVEKEVVR